MSNNLFHFYADYIRRILFYFFLFHYSIIISKLNKLGSILSQNPKKGIRKKQTKMIQVIKLLKLRTNIKRFKIR